ncbi:MAG: hypothetical protein ACOYON_06895 [Fimbriimonas sp.]
MKNNLMVAAVVAAFGMSAGASAQYTQKTVDFGAKGVSLRGGLAIPIDDKLKDEDSSLFNVGLDWQFGRPLFKGGDSYFSIDYFAKNLRGKRGTVIPILVNQKFYGPGEDGTRSYFFFGAGVSTIDFGSANSVFGIRGGAGKELGESIFFEVTAHLSDKADNGYRGNLFAFNVGYRF